MDSLDDALRAIDAIVEQGEGSSSARVPVAFRPLSLQFRGELSHYHKFSLLLHHREKLPAVYPVTPHDRAQAQSQAQAELQVRYRRFLSELGASFGAPGPEMSPSFWDAMFGLTGALIAVWESGACLDLDPEPA